MTIPVPYASAMPLIAGHHDIIIPPINEDDHTMGPSIKDYVSQRLHQDIRQRVWRTIHVMPSFQRPPDATLSTWETDRSRTPFNCQRPTTRILDENTIQLHCFPSPSYVRHYADIAATYLQWHIDQTFRTHVCLETCSMDILREALQQSNLSGCPVSDVIVLGEVHQLYGLQASPSLNIIPALGSSENTANNALDDKELFSWTVLRALDGRKVTLLGCKEGLWGETAGEVLNVLAQASKARSFLYIGKVGALSREFAPNSAIVTGNKAYMATAEPISRASEDLILVSWQNSLAEAVKSVETDIRIADGIIVSVESPLIESQQWLTQWQDKSDWVDCETAHIASAAVKCGVQLGYLHVVSDNLAYQHKDNLSNELKQTVIDRRRPLYKLIETIIVRFLELHK